jgi:hypothetical protein
MNPEQPHIYLSTACRHDMHAYCAAEVGAQGPKHPAQCKFCDARCVCLCHAGAGCPRE